MQGSQQSSQICNSDHLPCLVFFIGVNMEHALHLVAVAAFTQTGAREVPHIHSITKTCFRIMTGCSRPVSTL